jgi:hypothetical protein
MGDSLDATEEEMTRANNDVANLEALMVEARQKAKDLAKKKRAEVKAKTISDNILRYHIWRSEDNTQESFVWKNGKKCVIPKKGVLGDFRPWMENWNHRIPIWWTNQLAKWEREEKGEESGAEEPITQTKSGKVQTIKELVNERCDTLEALIKSQSEQIASMVSKFAINLILNLLML